MSGDFFRFWEGHFGQLKVWPQWKSEKNILLDFFNWTLFEKNSGSSSVNFPFLRVTTWTPEGTAPPPIWSHFSSPVLGGFWNDMKRWNWTSFDLKHPKKSFCLCPEFLSQLAAGSYWDCIPNLRSMMEKIACAGGCLRPQITKYFSSDTFEQRELRK